ncbi:MAG: hypothetical protein PHH54_06425 [Candidatus Nanoarchaeia archaeon]|nr:hypothetical protein [Candidatus Nanoarchaeia archaeon]MDD5741591.1 hypothetical protein [Candidatus Nanoarchaeia archaeon]
MEMQIRAISPQFDKRIVNYLSDLISKHENKKIIIPHTAGGEHNILLAGEYAVKYPLEYPSINPCYDKRRLIYEFNIAQNLEKIGLNVPKMFAVCSDEKTLFLIMKKLHLTPARELNRQQITEAARQFHYQINLAKTKGFNPGDTSISTLESLESFYNYGFCVENNKGYFFDFSKWVQEVD